MISPIFLLNYILKSQYLLVRLYFRLRLSPNLRLQQMKGERGENRNKQQPLLQILKDKLSLNNIYKQHHIITNLTPHLDIRLTDFMKIDLLKNCKREEVLALVKNIPSLLYFKRNTRGVEEEYIKLQYENRTKILLVTGIMAQCIQELIVEFNKRFYDGSRMQLAKKVNWNGFWFTIETVNEDIALNLKKFLRQKKKILEEGSSQYKMEKRRVRIIILSEDLFTILVDALTESKTIQFIENYKNGNPVSMQRRKSQDLIGSEGKCRIVYKPIPNIQDNSVKIDSRDEQFSDGFSESNSLNSDILESAKMKDLIETSDQGIQAENMGDCTTSLYEQEMKTVSRESSPEPNEQKNKQQRKIQLQHQNQIILRNQISNNQTQQFGILLTDQQSINQQAINQKTHQQNIDKSSEQQPNNQNNKPNASNKKFIPFPVKQSEPNFKAGECQTIDGLYTSINFTSMRRFLNYIVILAAIACSSYQYGCNAKVKNNVIDIDSTIPFVVRRQNTCVNHFNDIIANIEDMLAKGKHTQTLKLQSYKLDSQVLTSKINELNELKSELENTLTRQRMQESSIIDELQQLKLQNEKLRGQVSNLEFTKKSQAYLIQQLQQKLEGQHSKNQELQRMYENQENNKKQLQSFYQKKLSSIAIEKQQPKIIYENNVSTNRRQPINDQNKFHHLYDSRQSEKSETSSQGDLKQQSSKKIKRLKKPSIQSETSGRPSFKVQEKYQTPNVIPEKQQDSNLSCEDIYLEMIRQLYKQLLKIQLKSQDLLKIPQIEAFSQLRNPSKNDLGKLCGSYPFNIREAHKIHLIYDFMQKQLQRKGELFSGRSIISQILTAIEQIQGEKDIKSQQIDLSSNYSEREQQGGMYMNGELGRGRQNKNMVFAANTRDIGMRQSYDSRFENDSQTSLYY